MNCYNCGKFNNIKNIGQHLTGCDKTTPRLERNIKLLKYNNIFIEYDELYKKYIDDGMSALEIYKSLGIGNRYFLDLLEYHGIPPRKLKESFSKRVVEKRKKTCLVKYGVDNPAKSDEIKKKVASSFMKNYGVCNIFKTDEFKNSRDDIMLTKYGVKSLPNRYGNFNKWWDSQTKEYKKQVGKKLGESCKKWWHSLTDDRKLELTEKKIKYLKPFSDAKSSKLEDRVSSALAAYQIGHTRQKWISKKSYDFVIENTKFLIEVNGDFWHANPSLYHENDILKHNKDGVFARDIWIKDRLKKELAEKYGYHVCYIWEQDMKNIDDEELIEIIFQQLKNWILYENSEYKKN